MYRILSADKDTYVTDRVIANERVISGNVGEAATLDLFKLYGLTSSGSVPNIELSRLLVHFNLDSLRTLISESKIDTNSPSFNCTLKLFSVYAGQPLPRNFTVVVHPLSQSFDEGLGRDVVKYSDRDVCNFVSASRPNNAWHLSGANLGGPLGTDVDYLTSFVKNGITSSLASSQLFVVGNENLNVDVTTAISATLANIIPDCGFRIALTSSIEEDASTYFVKRFAARHAYDASYHPQLIIKFDDSIIDDTTNLRLNSSCSLILRNFDNLLPTNISSGSSVLTGSDCVVLKLEMPVSGGVYNLLFSGSQATVGSTLALTGVYSASVFVSQENAYVISKLNTTGSVAFTPIWQSVDGSVGYHTGSAITFYPSARGSSNVALKRYVVSVTEIPNEIDIADVRQVRVNIFDDTSSAIVITKIPVELPGLTIRNVYYRIRDNVSNDIVIPFDKEYHATRCSSDSAGMYFTLQPADLKVDHTYVIDIMIVIGNTNKIYLDASPIFKVKDSFITLA